MHSTRETMLPKKKERTPIQQVREFLHVGQKALPEKKHKPMKRVSDKRRGQLRIYGPRAKRFLEDHQICQVWLKENGWKESWPEAGWYYRLDEETFPLATTNRLVNVFNAPRSTQVHHKDKRRGARLNDETKWLAVCSKNHRRIEDNKAWARANGFLEDF